MVEIKLNARDSMSTARTLAQALPYIQRYDGSIIIIKLGGHAMSDDTAMANFVKYGDRIFQYLQSLNDEPQIRHRHNLKRKM